jgi:O-antigen/teichoic acid export membrane protein
MMRRWWTRNRRDLLCAVLLFGFPLLIFGAVSVGNQTMVPADGLVLFEPYRSVLEDRVDTVQNSLVLDLLLQNYVWKQFVVDTLRSGSLPLWDPHLFAGHPFLANGQHSALYPLTWIFFLMPVHQAFGAFIVLQLGLAGLWMYVLGRVLRAGRVGSLTAGVVFQLSGFMVISAVHPMIVAGASWLPLLLAFIECTVVRAGLPWRSRATLPWALAGAVALGLQILAGHAETTYFVLLVMAAYAGWRLLIRALLQPRRRWRSELLSPALGLVLMVGLGLMLGAAQWIPFYEVARTSFRQGGASLSEVLGWAYPKRRLITFLVPNFFGNPTHRAVRDVFTGKVVRATVNAHGEPIAAFDWGLKNYVEGAAYLGILPLLLAVVAVIEPPWRDRALGDARTVLGRLWRWLRRPHVPFFTGLALFSLGSIFGTPLYALVYALPFLDQSHSPFRWVFPLTVAVSILSGLGVRSVMNLRRNHPPGRRTGSRERSASGWARALLWGADSNAVTVVAAAAIWGGLLMGVTVLGSRWGFTAIEPWVERAFRSLANASRSFPDHRVFYAYLYPWLLTAAGFLLTGGIVLRVSRCPFAFKLGPWRLPLWEVLAPGIVLADLVIFGWGFHPAVDPSLLRVSPPVVAFLQQDTSPWRLTTFDPHGRNTLHANLSMMHGFQDVRGYDSVFSGQFVDYMTWIEPQHGLLYNRISPFTQFSSLDSPLTDLLNVKYVVTEEELPLPKYRQIYEDASVRVYENLGVMPRAFTLPETATLEVSDRASVAQTILEHDPRYRIIVEEGAEGWLGPAPPSLPEVATSSAGEPVGQVISRYSANEVMVDVRTAEPSWLVLTDTYAQGWKAFVRPLGTGQEDEQEVAIARVAGNFRGVRIDGDVTVRFKYSPNSVKIGVFLSFLGVMSGLLLTVVWVWRLIYRDSGAQSTVQRVAKNSIAPILLTLFNRAVDFAFAALMLRVLGPTNAGDYYFAINTFVWFDIITNFGLNTYLTREVSRHRGQARRYLVNTTLIRMALSLLAVPLLLSFIGIRQTAIANLTSPASRQAILSILLLYVGLIPNSISTGLTALFYAYEKAEYPAVITSLSTLLKVALGTGVLLLGHGIIGLAGMSIVVNLVTLTVLAAAAWRLFPVLRGPWEKRLDRWRERTRSLRREMIRASWPLMVNHLFATLFFKVDVFLMESILGSEPLGLYSIGYKFLDALNVVPSMFTMALFPVISRQAREDRQAFTRFYHLGAKILVTLALPAAILTTIVAREMVLVLGGADYLPGAADALRLIVWSMPIGWINSLTQYVLIALDRQRYLTRAYLVGFGFSFVANLLLMPRFGYRASALLHIGAELVLFVPFILGVLRELGKIDGWSFLGKPALAAAVTGAVAGVLYAFVGRSAAAVGALVIYPLLIWRLRLLTPEEQATLAPLFKRS